jgi:acyl-CoA thioester hydrolase
MKDFPVFIDIEVRWGDMDALVHVNNIVYFQYFQMARGAYLQRMGMPPAGPEWREFGWVVGANCCRYKAPVTFPDTLSVWTRVGSLSDDRMLMEYRAVSKKLGKVAAEGEALMYGYDFKSGQKAVIPDLVRAAILEVEGRELPPVPRDATRIKAGDPEPPMPAH